MSRALRILQVYNQYRRYGGEDTVASLEADLLRERGHEVERLLVSTKELDGAGFFRLACAGLGTVWSFRGYSAMKKAIARFSPDIVHVHNSFPLLSPSIFWAADRAGVPVVHTLHNFRLTCANSLLLRDGKPCQKCVGHFPWPGLRYRCFGSSFLRTAAVTSMNVAHRWLGTFETKVRAYIALTEFSNEIMVRAGLPRKKIFVKPNFCADPGKPATDRLPQLVFAGQIARLKGAHLLVEAWARLAPGGFRLLMIGDGPDRAELERRCAGIASIEWRGAQPREKVMEAMAASRWLVLPSLSYENFPMSVLEAFSTGTPVIVPDHGAFPEIVTNGREGRHFRAGDAAALEAALRIALDAEESAWAEWSAHARNKYLAEYTDRANYARLIAIYRHAMENFQAARNHAGRCRYAKTPAAVADPERWNS